MKKDDDRRSAFILGLVFATLGLLAALVTTPPTLAKLNRNANIQALVISMNISEEAVVGLIECSGVADEDCLSAPISEDNPIRVYVGTVDSIGGKWRSYASTQAYSELNLQKHTPGIKNWKNSIAQQPYQEVKVKVELLLLDDRATLYQYYPTDLVARVEYPSVSNMSTFQEVQVDFERSIRLFAVTPDEYGLMNRLNTAWGGLLIGWCFALMFLSLSGFCFWSLRKKG